MCRSETDDFTNDGTFGKMAHESVDPIHSPVPSMRTVVLIKDKFSMLSVYTDFTNLTGDGGGNHCK